MCFWFVNILKFDFHGLRIHKYWTRKRTKYSHSKSGLLGFLKKKWWKWYNNSPLVPYLRTGDRVPGFQFLPRTHQIEIASAIGWSGNWNDKSIALASGVYSSIRVEQKKVSVLCFCVCPFLVLFAFSSDRQKWQKTIDSLQSKRYYICPCASIIFFFIYVIRTLQYAKINLKCWSEQ